MSLFHKGQKKIGIVVVIFKTLFVVMINRNPHIFQLNAYIINGYKVRLLLLVNKLVKTCQMKEGQIFPGFVSFEITEIHVRTFSEL